jgi:hypothetical protein
MAPLDNSFVPPQGAARQFTYAGADLGIPDNSAFSSNGTKTGTLTAGNGAKQVVISATANHAGNLVLTTYLDDAGTVLQETVTTALTASTAGIAASTATKPFRSFKVAFTNTDSNAGTVTINAGLGQC